MDMSICRICGSAYNRHRLAECPFRERHGVRRAYDRLTGIESHKFLSVSPDGDEELREQHHFLPDRLLVQWVEGGRVVHEHVEDYPTLEEAAKEAP